MAPRAEPCRRPRRRLPDRQPRWLALRLGAVGRREVIQRAAATASASAVSPTSAHVGVLGIHLLPVAQAGCVGFVFTNSPAAIPPWGGKKPLFGTDPSRRSSRARGRSARDRPALTTVVRGRIMMAMRKGEKIPDGWALRPPCKPTNDRRKHRARQPVSDRRRERRHAGAHVRADLRRAHRLGDRTEAIRSYSKKATSAHRPGLHRHSIPAPLRTRQVPGACGNGGAHVCSPTRRCVCPRATLRRREKRAAQGIDIPEKLLAQIEKLAPQPMKTSPLLYTVR